MSRHLDNYISNAFEGILYQAIGEEFGVYDAGRAHVASNGHGDRYLAAGLILGGGNAMDMYDAGNYYRGRTDQAWVDRFPAYPDYSGYAYERGFNDGYSYGRADGFDHGYSHGRIDERYDNYYAGDPVGSYGHRVPDYGCGDYGYRDYGRMPFPAVYPSFDPWGCFG